MEKLELVDFLQTLGWTAGVARKLRDKAFDPATRAISATRADGRLSATVWAQCPDAWPAGTIAVWEKTAATPKSRTAQAVALVDQGVLAAHAAKMLGIDQSAVSRALSRRAHQRRCPVCQQAIKTPTDDLASS